ncbi:NB-ARC domain containing protein [Dorcoceras hygrometricum]|uniref:NB-ARC domain containing protein n=1 Tax=Dorcoceras hygrometricum TaxID=472368 RepID=A0A2Z7BWX3_9LAMI|nr:NB-ARC domain containing protein [Dorcoceras hygrometricum]
MASSLIANAIQINFDSVLGISDNVGMLNMFKALEASGLRGFLGCPSTLYERELEQFFNTVIVQEDDITCAVSGKYVAISESRFRGVFGLPTEGLTDIYAVPKDSIVQEGDITCAVSGKYVAISESRFRGVFGLPTEGLTDIYAVPKDLVYDARSIFSQSGEPVSFSCKKRLLKYEYRLLNDILAKSLIVKAGSFDAVTHERFLMMTAIHFGIKVNWSKILFEVLNEMVNKTIKRSKGFAVQICVLLKGDPAVTLGDETTFPQLKILSAKTVSTYVAMNNTTDSHGETVEPGVAKVEIVRKKSESAVETVLVEKKAMTSVDDVETIIGEVIAATEQLETDVVELDSAEDFVIRTDLTDIVEPLSKVLETTVSPMSDDESLTIEEHLAQIPEGMMLPSLTSAEPTKIKFCNEIEIRGVEDGDCLRNLKAMRSVKDILSKEEKMLAWAETDSLETAIQRRLLIISKYREVLLQKFLEARRTNLVPDLPTTAIDQRTLDLLSAAHQQAVRNLLRQMRAHGLKWRRPVSSMLFEEPNLERDLMPVGSVFGDSSIPRRIVDYVSYHIQILDSVLPDFSVQISPVVDITSAPTDSVLPSPHQSSTSASSMHFTDDILQGTETAGEQILEPSTAPTATAFIESFAQLRDCISQISIKKVQTQRSLDDLKSEQLFKINNLVRASVEARDQQTQSFRNSIKSVRREARTQGDVLSVKLNKFQKGTRAHRAFVTSELADIRKEVKTMDEKLATIRREMLDFCAQAQENHLNLSTQLGFLVDYINRGGDAKKGEGGSSHPQPPPDDQNRPSGGSGSRGSGGGGDSIRRRGSGGSRERHSSGGSGGGPIKRDAEYWIYGKRQF